MRRTLFFLLLLYACTSLNAQKPDNRGPWIYFPYVVGERTDHRLKVMIIGKHLVSFRSLVDASNVEVEMSLDFGKIRDQIDTDERYHPADYDNIGFSATKLEDLNGSYGNWHPETVRHNNLSPNDNTLTAVEKIRTKLIEEYRAKGYKVYQVDFNLDMNSYYKYYDAPNYKPIAFERLAPLSPLYVPVYRRGEIKVLLSEIKREVTSYGGSGLVIESSDSKKNSSSGTGSGSSGNSGGGSRKMTDEEIRIDISFRKTLAESAAAEGDKYYKMGALGYAAALQKYKEAQQQYYSADVQRRIDEINGWMALGQVMNQFSEGMDNLAANADPKKKTRWVYWGLTYGGIGGNFSKISNGQNHQPMEALLTLAGHRLCFSFEMRMGYYASPVYEYNITTNSYSGNTETPYKVQTQNAAIGMGLSGGLNIPLKSLLLYGMIGLDFNMFNVSHKMTPSQFSFEETPDAADFPTFPSRITLGANYKPQKSKVGFSVQYVMHSTNGETDGATPIKYSANPSGHYYLKRTTDEKYAYSDFSVAIIFAIR